MSDEIWQKPFAHHGDTGAIVRLSLVNSLLSLATMFIYRFWGKTRVRRYLWANTTAWGDPIEYTGTGKEMFLGFLIVAGVVLLPLFAVIVVGQILLQAGNPLGGVLVAVGQSVFFLLIPAGLYRARRYRLSRTVYRGIRAGLGGSAFKFALRWLGGLIVAGATLGLMLPWWEWTLERYKWRHTSFGDRTFSLEGGVGPLMKPYLLAWLSIPVLSASVTMVQVSLMEGPPENPAIIFVPFLVMLIFAPAWGYYRVCMLRRLVANLRWGEMRFAADFRLWPMVRLVLGNWVLTVFSLGILEPWAAMRVFRYVTANLATSGQPDFEAVRQNADERIRTGEGLASLLDVAAEV